MKMFYKFTAWIFGICLVLNVVMLGNPVSATKSDTVNVERRPIATSTPRPTRRPTATPTVSKQYTGQDWRTSSEGAKAEYLFYVVEQWEIPKAEWTATVYGLTICLDGANIDGLFDNEPLADMVAMCHLLIQSQQ